MGKTFKDRPGYRPKGVKSSRKGSGYRRGCKVHGVTDCDWCESNLTIKTKKIKQVKIKEWENGQEDE